MKDELVYRFNAGYVNSEDIVEVPDGSIIVPSVNSTYTKKGKPVSLKDFSAVTNLIANSGGSRAFTLDENLVGLMGLNNTSMKAIGNMIQASGRNLWFVGNTLASTFEIDSATDVTFGLDTFTVSGHGLISGSKIQFTSTSGTLPAPLIIDTYYYAINVLGDDFQLSETEGGAAVNLTDNGTGIHTVTIVANSPQNPVRILQNLSTVTGIGNLSSIPQVAKYNGSGWDSPVQVGLAPQTTSPEIILTTDTTRGATFTGKITGSFSARLARKRNGAVSIASGSSNVVTGDEDSAYITIPDYAEDGSEQDDRSWLLYLTMTGFGSQDAHLLFPIEIPESKLDGTDALGWEEVKGNARIKVVSQDVSVQANRKIEIEYFNNDLLTI